MREREKRRRVLLRVRMRSDAGWSDVVVRNISRRGMLISATEPVTPGSYIEIRRASHRIIARIMWADRDKIGARSQDPIDVDGLVAVANGEEATPGKGTGEKGLGGTRERRVFGRHAPHLGAHSAAARAEESRYLSSRLQYATLALVVLMASVLIATQVRYRLAAPFEKVRLALATAP